MLTASSFVFALGVLLNCIGLLVVFQGFQNQDISLEDRIVLVKQGLFGMIIVRYARLFTAKGMFVPSMKARIPRYTEHICSGHF